MFVEGDPLFVQAVENEPKCAQRIECLEVAVVIRIGIFNRGFASALQIVHTNGDDV